MIDQEFKQYATPTQWKYYTAVNQYGSHRKAAKSLSVNKSTITSAILRLKKVAAAQGYSPEHDMHKTTPSGFHVKGTSTLYKNGQPTLQWVKTQADQKEKYQLLEDSVRNITEAFPKHSDLVPAPKSVEKDLINVIPFGDPHIGLYCHRAEVHNDFNCNIAENIMISAVDHLVSTAPKADTALIVNLGDFFHSDLQDGVTARSGHKLDVDGRWSEVLEVGIRTIRRCIDTALIRHNKVVVMNAIGNHDDHSAQFLAIVLREYYRNNDRVEVKENQRAFQYHQFGSNLFGVTHGHTIKPVDLEGIMARDCNNEWSSTFNRKWFVGHFHSQRVHDMRNCTVEYYRTLAPGDAWSIASGYRSTRDMRCETWHRTLGHTGTNIFDAAMMS